MLNISLIYNASLTLELVMTLLVITLNQGYNLISFERRNSTELIMSCSKLNEGLPMIYIQTEQVSKRNEKHTAVIVNNSTCNITLTVANGEGAILANLAKSEMQINKVEPIVSIRYFLVQAANPWNFQAANSLGDSVDEGVLVQGRSIRFEVENKYLKSNSQIVVPFHYEWEKLGDVARSNIVHFVFSHK